MVSSEELECSCCYEILLNPTTLTCGHSFCRYCLAKWFSMSKKTECPECRQRWSGFPQVNVRLRSILEELFPEKVKEHKKSQESSPDYKMMLDQFKEYGKRHRSNEHASTSEEQLKVLFVTLLVVAGIVLVVIAFGLLYYIFFSEAKPSEKIYHRAVRDWTIEEVVAWCQDIEHHIHRDYSENFRKARIGGRLLLTLNESDLASPPLNISTALHRKMIAAEIGKLQLSEVRQPSNIWEYKNAHRRSALFLLFMLPDSPRLTFVYYHYMEYEGVFIPFFHIVLGEPECEAAVTESDNHADLLQRKCAYTKDSITLGEKVYFYIWVVLLPFYFISKLSWKFSERHFLTMWIITLHCFLLTIREILLFKFCISWKAIMRGAIDSVISFFVACIMFHMAICFIPTVVLDVIFFTKLYYGPFDTLDGIRTGDLRSNALGTIMAVFASAFNKLVALIMFLFNRQHHRQQPRLLVRAG